MTGFIYQTTLTDAAQGICMHHAFVACVPGPGMRRKAIAGDAGIAGGGRSAQATQVSTLPDD